jgi:hypothetical protein
MKLTVNQLRRIIKEEVSKTLIETSQAHNEARKRKVQDHERSDEARANLYLGIKKWNQNPAAGWPMIEMALSELVDLEAMNVDTAVDEALSIASELNYSEDEMQDLDSSVYDWFLNNKPPAARPRGPRFNMQNVTEFTHYNPKRISQAGKKALQDLVDALNNGKPYEQIVAKLTAYPDKYGDPVSKEKLIDKIEDLKGYVDFLSS